MQCYSKLSRAVGHIIGTGGHVIATTTLTRARCCGMLTNCPYSILDLQNPLQLTALDLEQTLNAYVDYYRLLQAPLSCGVLMCNDYTIVDVSLQLDVLLRFLGQRCRSI